MPCAPKRSRWPGNTDLPTTHSHTHSHKGKGGSTKRHTLIVITGRSCAVKKGSTFLRMFQICHSAEGEFNLSCPLSCYTRYEFSCTLKRGYRRRESTLRETMRQTQEASTETKGLTDVFGISPTANCSRQWEVALELWCGMIAHKLLIKCLRVCIRVTFLHPLIRDWKVSSSQCCGLSSEPWMDVSMSAFHRVTVHAELLWMWGVWQRLCRCTSLFLPQASQVMLTCHLLASMQVLEVWLLTLLMSGWDAGVSLEQKPGWQDSLIRCCRRRCHGPFG